WYAGGLMRSFHRYASDGLVVVMLVHLLREFSLDRYRGVRWFSWLTGVPVLMLVFIAIPLIALIVLWLHLQRISRPRINPPRGLAFGAGLALIALSIVDPAVSQGRANLAEVPGAVGL